MCSATPALEVIDPRGLRHREVLYCRSQTGQVPDARITRYRYDTGNREIDCWDPRLWGNTRQGTTSSSIYSLSGNALLTESADAGWRISSLSSASVELQSWDSRGCERRNSYDEQLRLVAVQEGEAGEALKFVERFTYGGASVSASGNQSGRVMRQDDMAGTLGGHQYSLDGLLLSQTRQFLSTLDSPDWPLDCALRDGLLDSETFVTASFYNAMRELRAHVDALGNTRIFKSSVSGELKEARLRMSNVGHSAHLLVSEIQYNAWGQVESERLGNGTKIIAEYEDENGRLRRLAVLHSCAYLLQDQHYLYDPVGNVRSIDDRAQPVRFYKNQRIFSVSCYRYDSLYQLVEASGREIEPPVYGPQLPTGQQAPLDPQRLRNYAQNFEYDAAGNLLVRHHSRAPTTRMAVSEFSNRSLGQYEGGSLPDEQDIVNGFDANGNQRELWQGQQMSWNSRNHLSRVTMIARKEGVDDDERYSYDSSGRRVRKERRNQAHGRTITRQTLYFPGLEIHRSNTGEPHGFVDIDLGRFRVRVKHWIGSSTSGTSSAPLLYCLKDSLGSGVLEFDENAGLVSQESYYPFGGTAWRASRTDLDAQYKTIGFSDKERDATGLYYYGFRYYAPWLCRWISPDPAGPVYGQNLYRMTENRPTTLVDRQGLKPVLPSAENRSSWQGDVGEHPDRLSEPSQRAQLFIKENFITDEVQQGSHEVSSTYIDEVDGNRYESWFVNEFHEDIWIFKQNYKTKPPVKGTSKSVVSDRFYASDVARYQYELVASKHGFYGRLPSIIKRENVLNYSALTRTGSSESDAAGMMNAFFTQTPNGKSTLRILEDFDLEPVSVERVKGSSGQVDFLIHVRPRTHIAAQQQENKENHDTFAQERREADPYSRFFGAEPLKGSIRRGSIDMARMERRGSDGRL